MKSRWLTALLLVAVTVPPLPGQAPPQPKPGDEMIEKYLAAKTDELSKRVLDGATTRAEWEQRLPRLSREYFDMLGLWPLPEKTPLKATVTGTLEHDGVVIEKLHFQSRPRLYVTGNLYRPRSVKGKLPAILYVCGHSDRGRDGNKSAYQHHGLWFAKNGYVCLIIDSLQLGEIRGIHHGTYGLRGKTPVETRFWWHAAGYTPAGVECWNGVRAIDYLVSRRDVDPDRIGVTGISGGGAATFWIAAADERVKAAVPVSGMSDLESYVKHKVINGHCDCMFLYNTYGWDWTTIAALVAPRPLLFANSDNDKIFPMDGNRRIIAKLRKLYAMYGKPELVDEYISQGGHEDRPDLRVAAFQWMNRHLKHDTTTPIGSVEFKPLPGKELRVFPEDKDIPANQINTKVDETFVPRAQVKLPEKGKFAEWKQNLVRELRTKVFRKMPQKIPAGKFEDINLASPVITEPGIIALQIFADNKKKQFYSSQGLLILVSPEDSQKGGEKYTKVVKPLLAERYGIALCTRGKGPAASFYSDLNWTIKSPPNYIQRSHALLGQTVDEGRVRDIAANVRLLVDSQGKVLVDVKERKRDWSVIGHGSEGILAAYAALFEPSIKEVIILDPPTSHKDGPYFLNVLRVLDIPDALGLLAPNIRLTLINARDPAFDRTEQIYRLAGAADKLQRK